MRINPIASRIKHSISFPSIPNYKIPWLHPLLSHLFQSTIISNPIIKSNCNGMVYINLSLLATTRLNLNSHPSINNQLINLDNLIDLNVASSLPLRMQKLSQNHHYYKLLIGANDSLPWLAFLQSTTAGDTAGGDTAGSAAGSAGIDVAGNAGNAAGDTAGNDTAGDTAGNDTPGNDTAGNDTLLSDTLVKHSTPSQQNNRNYGNQNNMKQTQNSIKQKRDTSTLLQWQHALGIYKHLLLPTTSPHHSSTLVPGSGRSINTPSLHAALVDQYAALTENNLWSVQLRVNVIKNPALSAEILAQYLAWHRFFGGNWNRLVDSVVKNSKTL